MEKNELLEAMKDAHIPESMAKYVNVSSKDEIADFVKAAKEGGIDFQAAAEKSKEEALEKAVREAMRLE